MFTGLIEEIGIVESIRTVNKSKLFRISARIILEDLKVEDSVSVSGVCLTATKVDQSAFEVTAVQETLEKSILNSIRPNEKVNLERAIRLNDRLGGHMVSGHVDGAGKVISVIPAGVGKRLEIGIPPDLSKYVIEKGSIAVSGISLTVATIRQNRVSISVIPYTLDNTTLGLLQTGDQVNIEVDMIGKYVEKLIRVSPDNNKMNEEWLKSKGF